MRRWVDGCVFFGIALMLAACGTQRPAPVVDRSGATGVRPDAAAGTSVPPAQRVAKEGIYTVQRGDTLYSIATSFGVDVRELARWNNLGDTASLSVGQTLRVGRSGDGALTLRPTKTRKKYSAAELNAQCNPRAPMPADLVAWDAMRPVGNEAL